MRYHVEKFLGLHTGEAQPPNGSAGVALNVRLDKIAGEIQTDNGMAEVSTLPLFPTPKRLKSGTSVTWKNLHTFKATADGSDRNFTVIVGDFTRVSSGDTLPNSDIAQVGVFITPYYDGSSWVTNAWLELTEQHEVEIGSVGASYFDLLDDAGSDLNGFADDYFNGWIAVLNNDFTTLTRNFVRVTDWTLSSKRLAIDGTTAELTTWTAGQKIRLFRNFFGAAIPSSSDSYLWTLFNELRLTTGNAATDLMVAGLYAEKTFGWSDAIKGMIAEAAHLNPISKAFKISNVRLTTGVGENALEQGTYSIKASCVLDDNQETDLRDISGDVSNNTLSEGDPVPAYGTVAGELVVSGTGLFAAFGGYLYRYDPSTMVVTHAWDSGGTIWAICNAGSSVAVMFDDGTLKMSLRDNDDLAEVQTDALTTALGSLDTDLVSDESDAVWILYADSGVSKIVRYDISAGTEGTPSSSLGAIYNRITWSSGKARLYVMQTIVGGNLLKIVDSTLVTEGGSITPGASIVPNDLAVGGDYLFVALSNGELHRIDLTTWTSDGEVYTGANTGWWQRRAVAFADSSVMFLSGNQVYLLDAEGDTLLSVLTLSGTWWYNDVAMDSSGNGYLRSTEPSVLQNTHELVKITQGTSTAATFDIGYDSKIEYKIMVSPSLLPKRAKAIRVYIEKDGGGYYAVADHSVLGGTWDATAWNADELHFFRKTTAYSEIDKVAFDAAADLAQTNLGRSATDPGEIKASMVVTLGNLSYAAGVRRSGILSQNKVVVSAIGAGVSMYDVFPNDVSTVIDVDYSDGDSVVGLAPAGTRMLVLKNQNVVIIAEDGAGGFTRDIAGQGLGCASRRTIVTFDDEAIWLSYAGVVGFSSRGLRYLSSPIDDVIRTSSRATLQAAFAIVDPNTYLYRICIGGLIYTLDLRSGEWTAGGGIQIACTVHAFAHGVANRRPLVLIKKTIADVFSVFEYTEAPDVNTNLIWQFQTSEIESGMGLGYDILVQAVAIEYESSSLIGVSLTPDKTAAKVVSLKNAALSTTPKRYVAWPPLGWRCKTFSVTLTSTISGASAYSKVRRLTVYYDVIPGAGDVYGV